MSTTTLTHPPDPGRRWRRWLTRWTAEPAWQERLSRARLPDEGLGYDRFGLEVEAARLHLSLSHRVAALGFEIDSQGGERLPTSGPFILTPTAMMTPLGLAAMLTGVDVMAHLPTPRMVRPLIDPEWAEVPWVGQWLSRAGFVWSTPEHVGSLARLGQVTLLLTGLGALSPKLVELALEGDAPFVPLSVVTAGRGAGLRRRVQIRYGRPMDVRALLDGRALTPNNLRVVTDELQSRVNARLEPGEAP